MATPLIAFWRQPLVSSMRYTRSKFALLYGHTHFCLFCGTCAGVRIESRTHEGTSTSCLASARSHRASTQSPSRCEYEIPNVVVMSSGTNTTTNVAYINNLQKSATSFAVIYGEFAYIGGTSGTVFEFNNGALGSLSSSTIHDGGGGGLGNAGGISKYRDCAGRG